MNIKFSDIKDDLLEIIQNKIKTDDHFKKGKLFLIDGFFNPLISGDSQEIVLKGLSVPMISLLNEDSNEIFYFSLFSLMPHLRNK